MTQEPGRTVAAFDFDGTLTRRDTLMPFLASLVGWPRVVRAAAADAAHLAAIAAGHADRDRAKERLLVRTLAGMPHADVARVGARYGAALARARVRRAMRERLAWHRAEGHHVVIVSASLDVYLRPAARALGADAVICTELEVDAHGLCTGRMAGGNCRGEAKAKRLREHLGDGPVLLWVYGDSAGDEAMLAMADHAVRVRRLG